MEIASWDAWYFDFSDKKSGAVVGKAQWHSEILQWQCNNSSVCDRHTELWLRADSSSRRSIDSEGRCICMAELLIYWASALLDSELLPGSSSTPRLWVAETFLNYCTCTSQVSIAPRIGNMYEDICEYAGFVHISKGWKLYIQNLLPPFSHSFIPCRTIDS